MQRPPIPLDVCCEVIDFVDSFDDYGTSKRTLAACARTSKAWLDRARSRLYRNIWLSDDVEKGPDETTPMRTFARTIADSPALGALVRRLQLDIYSWYQEENDEFNDSDYGSDDNDDDDNDNDGHDGGASSDNHAIIGHYPDFDADPRPFPLRAMQALSNLEALQFEILLPPLVDIPDSLLTFIPAFSKPSAGLRELLIAGICMEDLGTLVRIVRRFPRITTLLLKALLWMELDIPCVQDIAPNFCSHLVELEIYENLVLGSLLAIMPPTLRSLKMGPRMEKRDDEDPNEDFTAMARFTKLEKLHLTTRLDEPAEWFLDVLSHAQCTELRTLSLCYALGDVGYDSDDGSEVSPHTVPPELRERALLESVDGLLSKEPFLNLRALTIKIHSNVDDPDEDQEQELEGYINASLRQCRARGVQPSIEMPEYLV